MLYTFRRTYNSVSAFGIPRSIFHFASVHIYFAATGIYHVVRMKIAVIKSHHKRRSFENRSRLQKIAYGIVLSLAIVPVFAAFHVNYSFYIAGFYFH